MSRIIRFNLLLIVLLGCQRQIKPVVFVSQQADFHLVPANPLPKPSQKPTCYSDEKWTGWMCADRVLLEYCARAALHDYPSDNPEVLEWQEYCIKMGYMRDWTMEINKGK